MTLIQALIISVIILLDHTGLCVLNRKIENLEKELKEYRR